MNRAERRNAERYIAKESAKFPEHLMLWEPKNWPEHMTTTPRPNFIEVWRSREFLVQVFSSDDPSVVVRLSINRSALCGNEWQDNISWEVLQRLKSECGYALHDALEVFPSSRDVVNVANMRHLWVMRNPVSFAWRKAA